MPLRNVIREKDPIAIAIYAATRLIPCCGVEHWFHHDLSDEPDPQLLVVLQKSANCGVLYTNSGRVRKPSQILAFTTLVNIGSLRTIFSVRKV